jgi:4-hydroxy-tetrahydrodipicolinate synthase
MTPITQLAGVYAAMVTPLTETGAIDLSGIEKLMNFLAGRGCHGILLLGTTGEGPSFSPQERFLVLQEAAKVRAGLPGVRLLAGTGTPSLDETCQLTRQAYDLGFDATVVLPPYYYRKATDDGLFAWYDFILRKAVPSAGSLFGYHIPPVAGVGLSLDLLARLKEAHPGSFAGIKDSSGDPQFAQALGQSFGKELVILTGNDRLFSLALQSHASGCITAMANLYSPQLRQLWEEFQAGKEASLLQEKISAARAILDKVPPMPPLLKALLGYLHGFPAWTVKPPLMPLPDAALAPIGDQLITLFA